MFSVFLIYFMCWVSIELIIFKNDLYEVKILCFFVSIYFLSIFLVWCFDSCELIILFIGDKNLLYFLLILFNYWWLVILNILYSLFDLCLLGL